VCRAGDGREPGDRGGAVAERLAGAGADVVVGYGGGEETAAEVVARVEEAGRRAVAVGGDLVACYKGIE